MPEKANTFYLSNSVEHAGRDNRPAMIEVNNVSMVFNMASEQLNSLKEYAIALAKKELRFKELRALDNISFEVEKGDVFGILGTNGSGKSTMLKIVAGVLEPTEGTCEIHGNIAPLIELGAGFDLELTARENIYLNGALLGYSKKFINQHFDEIVDFAEVGDFLDMPMKNFSSGMVARVAFAIATVIVPDILIVDEVLSVGDFMFQKKCEDRIMSLIENHHVTVLIVSHSNDQIERLCNKAVWIEKGHVRMMGNAQEVCRVYRVLGGHAGSAESEQSVFAMLESPVPVPEETVFTIAGEDRYGSGVKFLEQSGLLKGKTILVVPGELIVPCMIATCLSGALEASVLHTKPDTLPDITAQTLKMLAPERVIILGDVSLVSKDVENEIREACGTDVDLQRVDECEPSRLAARSYHLALEIGSNWSSTAAITYNGCMGEFVSMSPYLYGKRIPILFSTSQNGMDEETAEILLSGLFDKLIVLGDEDNVPDCLLDPFMQAGLNIVRLSGKTPFEANDVVNSWLEKNATSDGAIDFENLVVCSVNDPFDLFASGIYAGATHSPYLLEDPSNLDSVAHAIARIHENKGRIKRLTFLGGSFWFNDLDKEILGKAVSKELEDTCVKSED